MRFGKIKIIRISLFLLLLSCSKQFKDRGLEINLSKCCKISAYEDGCNNISFMQASNKNILLIDRNQMTAFCYDLEGNFLGKMGKKGKAPGEFLYLSSISFFPDYFIATDVIKQKFIEFDNKFNFIKEFSIPNIPRFISCELFEDGNKILSYIEYRDYRNYSINSEFYEITNDFTNVKLISNVGKIKFDPRVIDTCSGKLLESIDNTNKIVALNKMEISNNINIDICTFKGTKITEINYPIDKVKTSKRSIEIIKNEYKEIKKKYPSFKTGKIPKYYPTIEDLKFDSNGNLWTYSRTEDSNKTLFRIFDKKFRYVGCTILNKHISGFVIENGKLIVSISANYSQNNEDIVYIYNIEY